MAKSTLAEKEKVTISYGTKLLDHGRASAPPPEAAHIIHEPLSGLTPATKGISELLTGLAKAITESSSKTLTGTKREKASEAADAERFYGILFGSLRDTVDEDGLFPTKSFVKATIHPLFLPVLAANKNSKATKAMQEAVESMAAELSMHNDRYASASNIFPRMFDQPLTAALNRPVGVPTYRPQPRRD